MKIHWAGIMIIFVLLLFKPENYYCLEKLLIMIFYKMHFEHCKLRTPLKIRRTFSKSLHKTMKQIF